MGETVAECNATLAASDAGRGLHRGPAPVTTTHL